MQARAADVAMRQKAGDLELSRTLAELAKQEKERAELQEKERAKREEEQKQQHSIAEAARVFAMNQMQSQIKGQVGLHGP